jgi:hypothetical protein
MLCVIQVSLFKQSTVKYKFTYLLKQNSLKYDCYLVNIFDLVNCCMLQLTSCLAVKEII